MDLASLKDVRALADFEFEVSSDVGEDEHLDELSIGHQKLRNSIRSGMNGD